VPAYDYTTVGHVTIDVLADGTRQPGGTAFYSALQAARLGLRALIVTQGDPPEIEALLAPYREELNLSVIPAAHTTTLQTDHYGGERRQRVLAWAGPLGEEIEVDTAILHLAPVARETPRRWLGRADFVGLTPQGLVRRWDVSGEITLAPLRPELLPARGDAWVLNEREHARCAESLARTVAAGTLAAITNGAEPTTLLVPGREPNQIPVPVLAAPTDDLGAGDVFAAAFFVALFEHQPPPWAATFAAAAAAVRVEGMGPGAIGDRAAIEARRRL
jgi:1D-myo-inositol 3-kinase